MSRRRQFLQGLRRATPRHWRRAAGVALALSTAQVGAADGRVAAQAFVEQARYLASEALAYEHGEGVPRDQAYAARLYCESARLGDREGLFALAWMYANGRGVERNDAYANTLFSMAAFLGSEHAQRMVRHTGEYSGAAPDCLHAPAHEQRPRSPITSLIARLSPARQEIARLLAELAPRYGVQPALALAIGVTESALNPLALSPKNAMGVMQLIPETALRFKVGQPYDAEQNIRGGLSYLRWLLAYFEGDVALVAAAYNAGEGAVERYRGVPPYRETQAYVDRILRHVGEGRHPFDHKVVTPSRKLRVAQNSELDT